MNLLKRPIVVIDKKGKIYNKTQLLSDNGELRYNGDPIFVYYNEIDHYDVFHIADEKTLNATQILEMLIEQTLHKKVEPIPKIDNDQYLSAARELRN